MFRPYDQTRETLQTVYVVPHLMFRRKPKLVGNQQLVNNGDVAVKVEEGEEEKKNDTICYLLGEVFVLATL